MNKVTSHFVVVLGVIITLSSCSQSMKAEIEIANTEPVPEKIETKFGFNLENFHISTDTVRRGWSWNDVFTTFNIDQYTINTTVKRLKDSLIGLEYIVPGDPFYIVKNASKNTPSHLVYPLSPFAYVKVNIQPDTVLISKNERPVEINHHIVSGVIEKNSNLSTEINKHFESYNLTAALTSKLAGVYAWSIDFFRLKVGDKFVVAFEEKCVDGKAYAIEDIKYAWFEHAGNGMYAFYFKDTAQQVSGFYDENAKALKRPFLKSPVKFGVITSPYTKRRFHPVLHRWKSHLGTDYAAPRGTPILATADGVIERASYTGGNGNYVKIRHNKVYETQYLHMSKIKEGMHPGVYVEQGEVIGFVGATGLATGPHVCYRFWKNGRQVDPRAQNFPESKPMKKEVRPAYFEHIKPLKKKLDNEINQLKKTHLPIV